MVSTATDYYRALAFLWGVIAILQLMSYHFRYPFPFYVAAGFIVSGIAFGVGLGRSITERRLASLERNGESRVSWGILMVGVGTVFVFGAFLLLLGPQIPNSFFTVLFDFMSPFIPAFFATVAILFRNWERKSKKYILQSMWSGKLYVYPYP
jgi:drug/metabolite transporter (DMT)-like permease